VAAAAAATIAAVPGSRYGKRFRFAEQLGPAERRLDQRIGKAIEAAPTAELAQHWCICGALHIEHCGYQIGEGSSLTGEEGLDVAQHTLPLGSDVTEVDGPPGLVDARRTGDMEGHLVDSDHPQTAREIGAVAPGFVERRCRHPDDG